MDRAQTIKEKQAEQLELFEQWAAREEWTRFHHAHYDWWMFPIDRSSAGQGDTYRAGPEERKALQADSDFMKNYRRGVELVVRSWGWSLEEEREVQPGLWHNYPVRFGKMLDSLQQFGEEELFHKVSACVKNYAELSRLEPWIQNLLSGKPSA